MVGNVKGVVAKGGASLEQVFQFLDSSGDNQVSHNGQLLSRRGCSLPASASGLDTHRDAITRRFGTQLAKIQAEFGAGIAQLRQQLEALLPTQTRLATLEAAQDQETHELRAGFFRETHGLREGMYPPR